MITAEDRVCLLKAEIAWKRVSAIMDAELQAELERIRQDKEKGGEA